MISNNFCNNARGEIILQINSKPMKLCLTMGALAQLENAFGLKNFFELGEKFQSLNANDILIILMVLLEGGQNSMSMQELKTAQIDPKIAAQKIAECFCFNEEKA